MTVTYIITANRIPMTGPDRRGRSSMSPSFFYPRILFSEFYCSRALRTCLLAPEHRHYDRKARSCAGHRHATAGSQDDLKDTEKYAPLVDTSVKRHSGHNMQPMKKADRAVFQQLIQQRLSRHRTLSVIATMSM